MTRKKIIAIIIGVIAVSVIGFIIYSNNFKSEEQVAIEVDRYTIEEPASVFINGTIEPKEVESFGTDFSLGSIDTIHVEDEEKVSAGDPIVTYKRDGVSQQIEQLEGQLESLKNASSQSAQLQGQTKDTVDINSLGQGSTIPNNLDLSQIDLSQLQASGIDLSQIDLSQLNIPQGAVGTTEGVISDIPTVDYDAQIATIEDQIERLRESEKTTEYSTIDGTASIEETTIQGGTSAERIVVRSEIFVARGSVSERNVLDLEKDMSADINIISTDRDIVGKIESISQIPESSSIDLSSLDINAAVAGGGNSSGQELSQYQVVFSLENQEDMLEGFHIQAKIVYGEDRIVIPQKSVVGENGKDYVYRIKDEKAIKTSVDIEEVKDENETRILVVSGLQYGDEIVSSDISKLSGGEKVE